MAEQALAAGLARLGTETAFEVLARARALEEQGRRVIHLEIGEPDFTTPRFIIEAGAQALLDGNTHYCPAPGLPVLREACAAHLSHHRGLADRRRPGADRTRREAVPLLRRPRHLRSRRRGHLPEPRLPDLRVGDPLGRGDAGAAAAPRGGRLRVRRPGPRRPAHAADAARDPQLARQPHRRHRAPRAQYRDRDRARRSTTAGSSPTRSTRSSCTTASTTRSRVTRTCSTGRSSSTGSRRPSP